MKHRTIVEERRIILFMHICIIGIKSCAHIRRKHLRSRQTAAQLQLAIAAAQLHDLCHTILKEFRMHTGRTHASDLFLINKQRHIGLLCLFLCQIQLCHNGCIRADSVIMPICIYHAAINTQITRRSRRYYFNLSRLEISLLNTVFFIKDIQHILLEQIFLAFCSLGSRAAKCDVQILSAERFVNILRALILCQMRQNI